LCERERSPQKNSEEGLTGDATVRKCLIISAGAVAAVAVLAWALSPPVMRQRNIVPRPAPNWPVRTQQDLDDEVFRLYLFHDEIEWTRAAVLDDAMSLSSAGERLATAAQRNNPDFLLAVERMYPGRTVCEQMVLMLLYQFAERERSKLLSPDQVSTVSRLRNEYEAETGQMLPAL